MASDLNERVMILWTVMFGPTNSNGLRGDVAKHSARLEKLEIFERQLRTLWSVTQWLALVVGTTITVLGSGQIGELVGRLFLSIGD